MKATVALEFVVDNRVFVIVLDLEEGKDVPGVAFRPEDNNFEIELVHATVQPDTRWQDVDQVRANMLYSGPPPKR